MNQSCCLFKGISDWVFDLDNTLYPPACNVFAQIDQRMMAFISSHLHLDPVQARILQKQYFLEYGTTLNGLMTCHNISPEAFLSYVHDIDVSIIPPAPKLGQAINALAGRKFIFTNGSHQHAENVCRQLGIWGEFDGVVCIKAMNYQPKPERSAYLTLLEKFDIDPKRAILFEDLPRNLETAHHLGFKTVLVRAPDIKDNEPLFQKSIEQAQCADYIDFITEDLTNFLHKLSKD